MRNATKIVYIFLISFGLNYVWEHMHSLLYTQYQGGRISEFVLFHATLGDACIITALFLPFLYISQKYKRIYYPWGLIIVASIISILIERYALSVGRWSYNSMMPIIPFLEVGLTPTIQIALTAILSTWLLGRMRHGSIN